MTRRVWIPWLLLAALVVGTVADRPDDREPIIAGEYRVLSGDFHLHSAAGSGGLLTPWGLVGQARREGLDVIAVTDHNSAWGGRAARAFSRLVAGPIVLAGEEVTSRTQDLIAVGIQSTIAPGLPLADQIAEIHRQGGVAIAAHPLAVFHEPYRRGGATDMLDGSEVCHPVMYERAGAGDELIAFASTIKATPIGSSDFHGSGRMGVCRTFIFVREGTERDVLEAIRAHRTVVYAGGRVFGDPNLVALADRAGLREVAERHTQAAGGPLDWASRVGAIAGLLGLAVAFGFSPRQAGMDSPQTSRQPSRISTPRM